MTNAKVTIVTVTYNLIAAGREAYFRECVESVHNQTYKNIEHIVVDGASNDGTVTLIQEYADRDWLTYISEPDSGIYDAMNKGINLATGKYIAFLNSDDFYHNLRAVELSVEALERTGAGFSYAPMILRTNHSQNDQTLTPNLYQCWSCMRVYHPTIFCQRELLERYSGFNPLFRIAADYHWLLKVLADGTLCTELAESIVTFRAGGICYTLDAIPETIFAIYDVMRSRIQVSWEVVCCMQAMGWLPWRTLRALVAAYPRKTRYKFYRTNMSSYMSHKISHIRFQVKTFRKNMINVRLTRGKRDIRFLGWTLINDCPPPAPPAPPDWAQNGDQ